MKNKKKELLIIAAVGLIALIAGFAVAAHKNSLLGKAAEVDAEAAAGPVDLTAQSEVTIYIKNFIYSPADIKIKKGTKVTWVNQDDMEHNVMREHDDGDKPHGAPTKEEVKPDKLAGPLLAKGESYSFTFNEVGTNPYHCSPHPYMTGMVTVVE
jgi:amicyanin